MKWFLEKLDFEPKSAELTADINTHPSPNHNTIHFPSYCFHVKRMADFLEEASTFHGEEKCASQLSRRYHIHTQSVRRPGLSVLMRIIWYDSPDCHVRFEEVVQPCQSEISTRARPIYWPTWALHRHISNNAEKMHNCLFSWIKF